MDKSQTGAEAQLVKWWQTARREVLDKVQAERTEALTAHDVRKLVDIIFTGFPTTRKSIANERELPPSLYELIVRANEAPSLAELRKIVFTEWCKRREPEYLWDIEGTTPVPVLSNTPDPNGAFLHQGHVTVISGAGGTGKSYLVLQIALAIAMGHPRIGGYNNHDIHQPRTDDCIFYNLLEKDKAPAPSPVLMLSYEDNLPLQKTRATNVLTGIFARDPAKEKDYTERLRNNLRALDVKGQPLFGPDEGNHYATRPVPQPLWMELEQNLAMVKPKVLIIDPATCAYVGDTLTLTAVREFIDALSILCEQHQVACLLVAHSTKDTRIEGSGRKKADSNNEHDSYAQYYDPRLVSGSSAWIDGVRAVLGILRAPGDDNENKRIISIVKSNYGLDRQALMVQSLRRQQQDTAVTKLSLAGFITGGQWGLNPLTLANTEDTPVMEETQRDTNYTRAMPEVATEDTAAVDNDSASDAALSDTAQQYTAESTEDEFGKNTEDVDENDF